MGATRRACGCSGEADAVSAHTPEAARSLWAPVKLACEALPLPPGGCVALTPSLADPRPVPGGYGERGIPGAEMAPRPRATMETAPNLYAL